MTPTTMRCLQCGGELPSDILGGHCPNCLVNVALKLSAAGGESDSFLETGFPRSFGDYELLGEIARGGMGVIFRARQRSLNRQVAVKMMLAGEFASPEFVRRFQREAEAAASLQHPHIVAIHEVGERDGRHFFSMDLIDGRNLAELAREQPLPARRAATIVRTIAEAVHYAHQHAVLHRDLKPSNILIDEFDQPHVTDFGLAKLFNTDAELTASNQALGSPSYMAPEQIAGGRSETGPRGDVYSLGAVLYHLLTGRPPFQGETLSSVLLQVQSADPVAPRLLNPSVPRDLETICLKCLEKEPGRRYVTAQDLADELGRFARDEPILARPPAPAERLARWCRRRPALASMVIALAVALIGGVTGVLSQWRRAEEHRRTAEQSERKTRLNLYAADLSAASVAVERGDFGLARQLLDAHVGGADQEDLRGFEWHFLNQRCQGQQRSTLTGHHWIVTCAAFSPEGRFLATGSQDHTVRVWDVDRQTLITNLATHAGAVWSVGFTPDGAQIMSSGSDHKVVFRSTATWEIKSQFDGQLAALSANGAILATSGGSPFDWEPAGKVTLWDRRSGHKVRELSQPGRRVALSPDGTTLGVANADRGVSIWNVGSGAMIRTLPTEEMLWSLAFSPSGDKLAATSYLKEHVYVWELERPSPPVRLAGHTRTAWCVAFSPDGHSLVTSGTDRSVRLWDAATGGLQTILRGHQNEVWCAVFGPDGRTIATGGKDNLVMLWSTAIPRGQQPLAHRHFARPFFSPDGRQVVTTLRTNDAHLSLVWDVAQHIPLATLTNKVAAGFSPDGQYLLFPAGSEASLEFWSVNSQRVERRVPLQLAEGTWPFHYLGFAAPSTVGFGIGGDGMVTVFETLTGKRLKAARGPKPKIRAAVMSPDGRHLAVSTEREPSVWCFEVSSGSERRLQGHRDFVAGLAFSPDGAVLASGSVDATIKLWDVATGRELATLTGHLEEATDVGFSPDGRTLASVGAKNAIKFWHVATRRELMTLEFPLAGFHLQFSPDGRHLAVAITRVLENEAVQLLGASALEESEGKRR